MLTLHQGRLKKLRMSWLGSRGVVRSYADKRVWRSHRWRSHQTGCIRQLVFALSACLTVLGGIGDLARAQDQQPRRVVSVCRSDAPPSAAGKIPDAPPKSKEARGLAANTAPLMFAGAFERLIERLNQAIEPDPDNPRLHINRGSAYLANQQFDKAIEDYDRGIALDPSSSIAFLGRAESYLRTADLAHAIEDFGEAIRLYPGNARAYLMRGTTYANKREYDRAIEDLDQSIKLDPECPIRLSHESADLQAEGRPRSRRQPTMTTRSNWTRIPEMRGHSCVGPAPMEVSKITIVPWKTSAEH